MYLVNPKDRQRYFIRLLLLHVKATSFESLRNINCVIHPTFYEAAVAKHLVNEDEEWDRCLKEAIQVQFPTALCELFSFICIYHNSINAVVCKIIFDQFFSFTSNTKDRRFTEKKERR